jgi:hypothetical protein
MSRALAFQWTDSLSLPAAELDQIKVEDILMLLKQTCFD